jgi:hypothetical protein
MPSDVPVKHSSANLTISLVVQQSSSSVPKSQVQETKEEYYYLDKQGNKVLVILNTIYF